MAAFSYAALDPRGKPFKGLIEAESKRQARAQLRDKGWTPLSVEDNTVGDVQSGSTGMRFGSSISVAHLAAFTRQMSIVLKAGIPLEEALSAVGRQTSKAKLRAIILGVRAGVLEGRSLAQSLSAWPNAFSDLYCATIGAGEQAGHLDIVMEQLADHTQRSHANVQRTRLALIYPILLFVMSMAIVAVLMVFVVPDIVEVYISQGAALPVLTRFLIDASEFLRSKGVYLVIGVLLTIGAIQYALMKPALRRRWHRALLRLPLLGGLVKRFNAARFAGTLSILSSGGVPLVEAIRIAGDVLGNVYIRDKVREVGQQVEEGGSLHLGLEQSGQFPPLMIHMIASGESAGELDAMLARVADNEQQELDNLVATLVSLFEPATLLIMGGVVLVIVVAILQPILSLNQLI
jgi:general secretion pathway protein F